MEFEGEYAESSFSVSAGPTPVIGISSRYMAKGLPVEFDGSNSETRNNRSIVAWNWHFGDGSSESGETVSHTYTTFGNYSVVLSVRDSLGAEANESIAVHIIPLEDHLSNEFQRLGALFSESKLNAIALKGEIVGFYDFMGYEGRIEINENIVNTLEDNFTSVKNSEVSDKEIQYANLANDLHLVLETTPLNIIKKGSKNVRNLLITGPGDVFDYSGDGKYNLAYADAIYNFNRNNVDIDMDSTLIQVEFLEGKSSYLYVRKSILVGDSEGAVIVEDLRGAINNLGEVFGGSKVDYSRVISWNIINNPTDIKYVIQTDNLETINTIVYSDVDVIGGEMYCFDDPSCDKYCGDGICTIANYLGVDESDELDNNYCASDCVLNNPMIKYIILFVVVVLFVVYYLFYKGPGSVKDIVNKLSFGVSGKKVFITERDKITLKSFINLSFKRGYNQMQIQGALLKKGWNKPQIEEVMKNFNGN